MMPISKNLKKLNILYAEDDEMVNMIFSKIFKKFSKNIYSALNGEEGLELFKNNPIDIVITDIQMPKMSGMEMAKEIRKIKEDVPIIFTTAFGDSEYLKDAIDIGVDAYILKPIDKNKLLKKINKIADNLVLKEELENYTKLMKIVFDYLPNGVLLLDKDFNVIFYNNIISLLKEEDNDFCNYIKSKIINFLKENNENDLKRVISITYNDKFYELKIVKVDNYFLVNCLDITRHKKEINKVEDNSLKDELTGAYNRKKIDKIMDILINKNICLIMSDIDNFKRINDIYGHLKGDEVLKKMSIEIQNHLRNDDLFIRWGGEEFIVLLQNSTLENAERIAEKLRKVVNSIEIEEVGHFSLSFGVSCGVIEREVDFDKILKQSDDALYLAKNNGKNRVELYWK